MKKIFLFSVAVTALIVVCLNGCKKIEAPAVGTPIDNNNGDLTTKITTAVSGFVTDESDLPVQGALVTAGTKTATTDVRGYFEITATDLVKNAAVVSVNKTGYFPGIKTWVAIADKPGFFRIKLLAKTNAGTVSGTTGGNITLSNGLSISFPAAAFVNALSGAAYTGTVNVAAKWIDPTATDLYSRMPGDLRGKNAADSLKSLQTYGMSATELTGSAGELLQIAPGKKATLTIPIPVSLVSSAPAAIPLWYFNETTGLWKEQGSATRTGSTYVGDVTHFSFWNCDVPNNYIYVDVTVDDAGGNPVQGALVKITNLSTGVYAFGFTDASGFVSGAVASNTQFLLQVLSGYNCPFILQAQNFSTSNVNLSLGAISLISNRTATVTGNITNCNNDAVTNGRVFIGHDNVYEVVNTNTTGAYSAFIPVCSGSTINASISALNLSTTMESPVTTAVLQAGTSNPFNLQACNTVGGLEFLDYHIDNAQHTYNMPLDTVYFDNNPTSGTYLLRGYKQTGSANPYPTTLAFNAAGIGVGSTQTFTFLLSHEYDYFPGAGITGSFNVTITEFGPVTTGYIAGTFSGTVTVGGTVNHPLTGSFRAKRPY